jgi:hypothetical protein
MFAVVGVPMLAVLVDYNLFCVEPHAGRAYLGARKL